MKSAGKDARLKDRMKPVKPEKVRDYAAEIGMEIVPANRQAPMWPPQADKVVNLGLAKADKK